MNNQFPPPGWFMRPETWPYWTPNWLMGARAEVIRGHLECRRAGDLAWWNPRKSHRAARDFGSKHH